MKEKIKERDDEIKELQKARASVEEKLKQKTKEVERERVHSFQSHAKPSTNRALAKTKQADNLA